MWIILKFKNETNESDISLFDLSSLDNHMKYGKQSWLWFVTSEFYVFWNIVYSWNLYK